MLYDILFQKLASSPYTKFAHSLLAGIMGTMILLFFFSALMTLDSIGRLLPWIVGFNGAMTGFMLVDKTKDHLNYRLLVTMGTGLLLVVGVFLLTNLLFQDYWGVALIRMQDMLVLIPAGTVLSGLGGSLAAKYGRIQRA